MGRLTITLVFSALLCSLSADAQSPKPKKRADSFFGIHFDFHASASDTLIGKRLTTAMIDSMLTAVNPDFIQVDTKGHPGISSYPTKVGSSPKKFIADPLQLFRDATLKRGIALYSHYSGILDAKAVADHPDWARTDMNGKKNAAAISIFGPYIDQLLIPQLKELSNTYHINGVWVDGEDWAMGNDISTPALAAYQSATGKTFNAATANAQQKDDYTAFNRTAFHQYLNKYATALHRFDPNFQITSNWSFSSFMPGPVDAAIDYISGDVTSDDAATVDFEARCMAPQGKPWDLMIWGFSSDKDGKGFYWKPADRLKIGGTKILSQGGAYQIYIPQNHDASLHTETIPMLKEVAEFCREREAFCFKTQPIPQVALLLSSTEKYKEAKSLFNNNDGGNDRVKATLSGLLNAGYSVEVLQEHHLKNTLNKYPLLVIPEYNNLEPALISQVKAYVAKGGRVMVIGKKSSALFTDVLEAAPIDSNNSAHLITRSGNLGKGKMLCIYTDAKNYPSISGEQLRQTTAALIHQLFPEPIAQIEGSNKIHLTINTKNKATLLHLVNENTTPVLVNNVNDVKLTPIQPFILSYRSAAKPKTVFLEPGHIPLNYSYSGDLGLSKISIPQIDIYSIVVIR